LYLLQRIQTFCDIFYEISNIIFVRYLLFLTVEKHRR